MELVCKTVIMSPDPVDIAKKSSQVFKEMHFYSDIIPAIEQFEQITNVPTTERIDAFVKCFGSRMSSNPSKSFSQSISNPISILKYSFVAFAIEDAENVDADAVILFENLKLSNFTNGDRKNGFEKDAILAILQVILSFKLISCIIWMVHTNTFDKLFGHSITKELKLQRLAKMHALGIAMRRLQPTLFYSKIDPFLEKNQIINAFHYDKVTGSTECDLRST